MKKIALILSTNPQVGGGHQYAMLVAECLAKNRGTNYELVAICYNAFWSRWCRKNKIRCLEELIPDLSESARKFNYFCPALAAAYNTFLTSFGKMIRQEKIDILCSTQQMMFLPNYNTKIITPVHDLMHRYERRFPEVAEDYERRETVMKSLARYADCILVDSKLGKKQFKESYMKMGVRKPIIVSLPFIVPEHIRNRKQEYVNVPAKYVFYPAQFWQHKNHINLVKAIGLLKNSIEDIHLVLVGSEKNCYQEIRKYILRNGLENNITILGFVSDENMSYLYSHAVGMIMPSYFGPTNMPPLEAMALGCPVAVSNRYAMPEQVGNAGLLFNPDSPGEIAECIEKLWNDDVLRENLKRLGYTRSHKWTKKEFDKKLQKVIGTLLYQ